MSISELFIKRPVMTTLVMAGILVFGLMAYRLLAVSNLPNVDFPTITVSASLPGASPETMASAVATPLEKQFSTITGVDQMTSQSALGSTTITLQFTLDRNIDAAAQDVNAAISKTLRLLPSGILPPSYQKVNPADQPIIYYAMSSKTLSLSALDEYAETFIAQRLSTVEGVAQVNVYGAAKYAVRIQLDPKALATRQIGIDEVADAVASGNVNLPTGILWGPHRAYTVQATGQLQNAAELRPLVLAFRNGAPVRMQDLGQVLDDVQDNKSAAWYNGSRSIILAIQRQPGANTVDVAARVRTVMASLRDLLPASVNLQLRFDRSDSILAGLADVRFTLFLTLALVVLVIFLFLRNLSATVIPSLALPFSIVGTFAVMYALDYSLDNLSMMALTLSVGFVVDDAIVMLENIVRHMEKGTPPLEAAFTGAREVGFTILSMTLSLAAVFIPVLFMGGIVGRLFHEFAVTIGAAILVSGVVSLTLTPMLCSRFLKASRETQHGRFYEASERVYQRVLGWYEGSLGWVMERRPAALAFSAAILVATVVLFVLVPKGFLPSDDNANRLTTELRKLPDLLNVTSDLQISNPQATVTINRDRAGALGVTAQQVEEALYDAYGSRQVSTIYTATNQYWVVMELLPQYQQDLSALNLLYIRSQNGTLVPLASLATLTSSVGPLTVSHSGQLPSVTISFDLREGVAIGTADAQVQRIARQILPSSITTSFSGTAQAFQSSQAGLLFLLILAVFVIYMVLGILYESFIHPLTILSALPFAGFGALLTLLIFRVDLTVYAFVGVIMLVGLVKKNGIMMIDFALEAQRNEGKSAREAILQACSIRFRPIMMTTMAALMGTLPIALGVGVGSESRRPLGIAVVGGLAFSQFVTLYVTPVIATYLDALHKRLGRTSLGRAASGHPTPEAAPAD